MLDTLEIHVSDTCLNAKPESLNPKPELKP